MLPPRARRFDLSAALEVNVLECESRLDVPNPNPGDDFMLLRGCLVKLLRRVEARYRESSAASTMFLPP